MFPEENEILTPGQVLEKALQIAMENPEKVLVGNSKRLSLYEFLQDFWDEVADTDFKDNWHIKYICEQLEEVAFRVARNLPRKHDLIINVPPGTTKTLICSIMFPAWCWSMGWWWMRFICASYSEKLSLESAEKSRDLVRSDHFRRLFPSLIIKEDKDTKSNFRVGKFVNGRYRAGGNRFSTSVGGTLTGFHAHIIIVDDPLNPEQAASEKELENCNRWMEQTLPTRKVDKEVATTVLIMQRLHQGDPTGRALERKKTKLRHICLPGQLEGYQKFLTPPELVKNYKKGLLDPVRLGPGALHDLLEDLGQYGFAGQIGQNPVPPGGGLFKPDMMPMVETIENLKIVRTLRYWDKAGTEKKKSPYTVGFKMSLLRGKRFLIQDVKRGRWGTDVRERIIRSTAEADGVNVHIFIEQEPGSGGKESAQATIRNLAGFSVYADRPTGEKVRRADPFSVQVNEGNVMMLKGDWNAACKEELGMFPFGVYKDQVDAGSGAFNKLAQKKEVRIIR
jgi:predicted phage terminase large subunit-like protein